MVHPEIDDNMKKIIETNLNMRRKYKNIADAKRHTKLSKFQEGDIVLCKQIKKNKLTPPFDPDPYTISQINGSRITATRRNKTIVRNSSFFKLFHQSFPNSPETSISNLNEIETDRREPPKEVFDPLEQRVAVQDDDNEVNETEVEDQDNSQTRPIRNRKAPRYLQDYVVNKTLFSLHLGRKCHGVTFKHPATY